MRLSRSFLLPLLPLALTTGAAMAGTPVPRDVRLSDEVLTISLTDGTLCRLKNWQARPAGQFDSCAGLAYAITVETNPNPLRRLLQGVDDAVSGKLLAPMAEIVLTDAAGRSHHFTSPVPLEDFDW